MIGAGAASAFDPLRTFATIACENGLVQIVRVLLLSLLVAAASPSGQPANAWRVKVTSGPLHSSACQFWGDAKVLQILRNGVVLLRQGYCSAYGQGGARLITDQGGRRFVLLEYFEGHGTRASTGYLRVYELHGKQLKDRGRLVKSEPIGMEADLVFDMSVKTLPKGGIIISARPRIERNLRPGEAAPSTRAVSLTVN